MTRVFGVNRSHDENGKKSRLNGKSFCSYYKNLYDFLIDELKQCAKSLVENKSSMIFIQPSLYPILLLLARLYPAPGEEDTILCAFVPYLKVCASSPIWKTRKLVARTLVAFTPQEKILLNLESLIEELNNAVYLIQNEIHGKMLQVLYYLEEIRSLPDIDKNSLKSVLKFLFNNCLNLYIRNNKCASTKAAFLQIYLYAMVLDIELDSPALFEILYEELSHPCTGPDKDNFVAICTAIIFLKELQLYTNKAASDMLTNEISMNFFKYATNSHQSIINFTIIEILLWLLQENTAYIKYNLDISDDIVVVQNVMKIVILLNKKNYNARHFINERCSDYVLGMLNSVADSSLLRQVFKLLSFMPFSVSVEWKFLKKSHTWHLIDKLEYILNLMEMHSRDDLTSELLTYSTHLIAKLAEEMEMTLVSKNDTEVIKNWFEKVEESASPDNSILIRNTVVSVLKILAHKSFFPKSFLLGTYHLWQPLLLLLVDDEPDIKYRASEIVMEMKFPENNGNGVTAVVPSKAVDLMMELFIENNGDKPEECIIILINWMLSSDVISYKAITDEQPFDKGELNVFSEDLNLTSIVSNHLSAYLSSLNLSKCNLILPGRLLRWNNQEDQYLSFTDIIKLCLSEAHTAMKNILARGAISLLLDAHFDQDFIYFSQRLAIVTVLLPFSDAHPDFIMLCNKLLKQLQNLDFRTFFIDELISKVQHFITFLTVPVI